MVHTNVRLFDHRDDADTRQAARPSPFEGRQSPFRRQNTASPAPPARATTPGSSPTKATPSLSPTKPSGLSPEKISPFVRRPSQISHSSDRPTSPFGRPISSLSIPATLPRKASDASRTGSLSPALLSPIDPPATFSVRKEQTLSPPSISPTTQPTASPFQEEQDSQIVSPTLPSRFDGAHSSSKERRSEDSEFLPSPSRVNLRPTTQRTTTSSTAATIKPPVFTQHNKMAPAPKLNAVGRSGAYNHIPQPLLHSMRESFEVLDSNTTGTVNAAAVSETLGQLGLDNTPAALKEFFPPNGPAQLNLARYLDTLSGLMTDMSPPEELRAAFEAFDIDDSGQIDVGVLRDALMHTAPQPGEDMIRFSDREVDNILAEFTSRRAFGSKGMNASKTKGDVFKYRDFMANISGGGGTSNGGDAISA